MPKRLLVLQFSCEEDRSCTEQSLRSVERMERCWGDRLDLTWQPVFKEEDRGRHINGLGALQEIWSHIAAADYDWVLKLDSDTLWTGAAWLDYLNGPWLMIGGLDHAMPHPYVRGHAYLIRPQALRNLPTNDPEEIAALAGQLDHFTKGALTRFQDPLLQWPEDEALSTLMRYCYGEDALLGLPAEDPAGFYGYWSFEADGAGAQLAPEKAQRLAAAHSFIEFGRFGNYSGGVATRGERRQQYTAPAMRAMNALLDT